MIPQSDAAVADGETEMLDSVATLSDLMEWRARHQGETTALIFLRDGENEESRLTYAELDERTRSLAGWLQKNGYAGERVLLLHPSGLDFIASFLGCIRAGAVPVPAYPPRMNRNLIRLGSIVADARAGIALTSASIQNRMAPMLAEAGLASLRLESTDRLSDDEANHWRKPAADRDTLAFLQYTSGSTSHPKGVMVTHGNLLENHRMMEQAFGQTRKSRIVTWLPLFHDMGLIGNVLQAFYLGTQCVILPPEMFLVKPVRWLAAISRYRGTFSGAPNFAYELCVRKITDEQRCNLDLSCWESAFVGAEPVRHETMKQFAEAFAPCAFRREALYPCYGLAEASLFVSGAGKLAGARSGWFSAAALERHRVVETEPEHGPDARPLVSCGHAWLEERIVVADPDTGRRCPAGSAGEIWISGPHVARGYWNRPEETKETFAARLTGEDGMSHLRTGDLGFVREGELFISGRLKDLIIIAGRNHDPVDIEHTTEAAHLAIRPGGCAAFQVDFGAETLLVIAAELERTCGISARDGSSNSDFSETLNSIAQSVREAVALYHDLAAHDVVFLRPASLPKTSSGKIQRHACRSGYLNKTLNRWIAKK